METVGLTHRMVVAEIQRIKNEIDLIKSLPAWTYDKQDAILVLLNKQLENELEEYHKLLMEIKITK